jgi:tRNA(Ile)-lysidine synthase
MPLLPFESRLAASWPPESWQDVTVVVAVSGGADSIALLRAMAALKTAGRGRLIVAHFNHRLRPEADADARFVVELAERLHLPRELGEGCVAKTAAAAGDGLEAAARNERYAFLQSTAEPLGARYVVTAHTADDQAETILHRILRGTGIAGLAGMRRARPLGPAVTLIRPLLDVRRAEVLPYLAERHQPFRDDATNLDPRFTRNRIRHNLLPQLAADYNPDVVAAVLRLGQTALDAQQFIDSAARELARQFVRTNGFPRDCVMVDCAALSRVNRHLLREMFIAIWRDRGWPQQSMGFAEWDALATMTLQNDSSPPQRILPGNFVARRTGDQLSVRRFGDDSQ